MELDREIEFLRRARKILSYAVMIGWGIPIVRLLLVLFSMNTFDFGLLLICMFIYCVLCIGVLSGRGIRDGKITALGILILISCVLTYTQGMRISTEGISNQGWLALSYFLILITLYWVSMFLIARHLWLMRKARIRDEKLAVQEG